MHKCRTVALPVAMDVVSGSEVWTDATSVGLVTVGVVEVAAKDDDVGSDFRKVW
jgi:hypothetical protein